MHSGMCLKIHEVLSFTSCCIYLLTYPFMLFCPYKLASVLWLINITHYIHIYICSVFVLCVCVSVFIDALHMYTNQSLVLQQLCVLYSATVRTKSVKGLH